MGTLFAGILFVICCMGSGLAYRSTPGYVFKHDPYIYKIVIEKYDKRTWNESRKICQEEENGELLTFGDPTEAAWVNRLLANLTGEMGYLGRFWIGATDTRLRGVYEYIDDSPFKYKEAPWAKGEPNRPTGFEYNYCIVTETKDKSPQWSDEDCFQSFGYICKSKDAPRRLRAVQRFGYSWEWNYYDYKFVILPDDSMTWSEAEIYCQEAESGHLLSIYNSKESEWVTDRIRQIRQVLGFQELWIGATDIFSKGQFKWTDEKPVNYTKWRNGTNILAARKPREACVSILAHPNWGDWNEEYCIKKLPFVCKTKKCQGKSDLAFIVDASGSVTASGFEKAKMFMFQVIRGFQVTNNQTNIALIVYSDNAELIFGFNKHYGQLQLKKAIDNMPFTKGETFTNKALDLARTAVFSKDGNSRDDVPKMALLMTDGKSKIPLKTALAAKKLKAEGVTLVPLGIGDGVDRKELVSMASNYKDTLYVQSYAHLGAKVKDIRQRVCDEIIRVGLIQAKIRAAEEKRRLAFEAKQRLEAEKRRKMSEEEKKREDAKKRLLEIARKKDEEKKREQNRKRQEEAKKREEARKRVAQRNRNRYNQRNTQNRYNQRNRNTQNRNTQNRYNQNRNTQNRYNQRNRNTQNRNTQNRNIQNRNNQNRNTQNRYNQRNRNTQNRNTQNRNIQNRNNQNRNTQNRYNQRNRNTPNRNTQNRNIQNRNNQYRNTQNRYNQRNRNTQNRNTQNRNIQNRYNQNRNTQNRYNQRNRNTQNRNIQNRYNQNRNTQNRYNQRNRNTQNRNIQNRYNQNRNTQYRNRYNQNRNQNRYNQNRNTQNRNNRNRYQG